MFNLEVTHESQIFPSSPARKGKPLVTDPAAIDVPPYYPDTPLVREELARMYDNIADMDGQVGEILKQLEDDGLAENTIVFYWSDHGDGVPRAKRSLYDSGLRVPLMIRWPKGLGSTLTPGSVNERSRQLDRSRSDRAGARRRRDSRASAGPRARRPEGQVRRREFVFAARDRMDTEYDMMRSARDGRFLYIRNFSPELPYAGHIIYRNQSAIMQEWFRLQAEGQADRPGRAVDADLAARRRAVRHARPIRIRSAICRPSRRTAQTLERMRRAVTDWMARINDQGLVNEPEMIQRMWPGGVQPETAQPYIVSRRETEVRRAASR